jgi:hypothetical protein
MAPSKMLDPGVNRRYEADSSSAAHDVLALTFGEVGLTPGDRYWVWVDAQTGRMDRWAYVLQNQTPDAAPTVWRWTGYTSFDTPGGPITLATRKERAGSPVALLTDAISTAPLPADLLSDSSGTIHESPSR